MNVSQPPLEYTCFWCPRDETDYQNISILRQHIEERHPSQSLYCQRPCRKYFDSPDALREHNRLMHRVGEQLSCVKCSFGTTDGDMALDFHVFEKHRAHLPSPLQDAAERPSASNQAPSTAPAQAESLHTAKDVGAGQSSSKIDAAHIMCSHCSTSHNLKVFLTILELRRHHTINHELREHCVGKCLSSFTTHSDLRCHAMLTHGVNLDVLRDDAAKMNVTEFFTCLYCGRDPPTRCKSIAGLRRHNFRAHKLSFHCRSDCPYSFETKDELKQLQAAERGGGSP